MRTNILQKKDVDATPIDDNGTDNSEVPKVVRSHNSQSNDNKMGKWMVTAFGGGKKRAKEREVHEKKTAALANSKYFVTDDCPAEFEIGKAFWPNYALEDGPWEMRRLRKCH